MNGAVVASLKAEQTSSNRFKGCKGGVKLRRSRSELGKGELVTR